MEKPYNMKIVKIELNTEILDYTMDCIMLTESGPKMQGKATKIQRVWNIYLFGKYVFKVKGRKLDV